MTVEPPKPDPIEIIRALQQQLATRNALIAALSQANQKIVHEYHEDVNPIEISTKVSNELTAKGEPKPAAEVRITRKLPQSATETVARIIISDMELGMEETAKVIQQAVQKVGEDKVVGGEK